MINESCEICGKSAVGYYEHLGMPGIPLCKNCRCMFVGFDNTDDWDYDDEEENDDDDYSV